MRSFTFTVKDKCGIHARPAGVIVNAARVFSSEITVKKQSASGESEADAKRLISLMSLGVRAGETVSFIISGEDEESAAAELERVCRETLCRGED